MADATGPSSTEGASSLTLGEAYDTFTYGRFNRNWYGLSDTLQRCGLTFATFYFYALTQPLSFSTFWWKYSFIWWPDRRKALAHACSYPVVPFVTFCEQLWAAVKRIGVPPPTDLKSKVWFSLPERFLPCVLHTTAASMGKFLSLFLFCGLDREALHCSSSYLATPLNKDFWRKMMSGAGCRVAEELGRWDGKTLTLYQPIGDKDVVFKVVRGSFGEGDQFLENGKDFKTVEDLERLIKESEYVNNVGNLIKGYSYCDMMLLEWCRAAPEFGVHTLDILTVATPAGPRVLNCMYWGECTGPSSHSTTAGYMIDVEKEEITATGPWYGPFFATQSTKLMGMKVPGVRKACEDAIKAHANTPKSWMAVIGWDAMIMKNGEVVFFEGNFGVYRIPRRVFLTPGLLRWWVKNYEWPFVSPKIKVQSAL